MSQKEELPRFAALTVRTLRNLFNFISIFDNAQRILEIDRFEKARDNFGEVVRSVNGESAIEERVFFSEPEVLHQVFSRDCVEADLLSVLFLERHVERDPVDQDFRVVSRYASEESPVERLFDFGTEHVDPHEILGFGGQLVLELFGVLWVQVFAFELFDCGLERVPDVLFDEGISQSDVEEQDRGQGFGDVAQLAQVEDPASPSVLDFLPDDVVVLVFSDVLANHGHEDNRGKANNHDHVSSIEIHKVSLQRSKLFRVLRQHFLSVVDHKHGQGNNHQHGRRSHDQTRNTVARHRARAVLIPAQVAFLVLIQHNRRHNAKHGQVEKPSFDLFAVQIEHSEQNVHEEGRVVADFHEGADDGHEGFDLAEGAAVVVVFGEELGFVAGSEPVNGEEQLGDGDHHDQVSWAPPELLGEDVAEEEPHGSHETDWADYDVCVGVEVVQQVVVVVYGWAWLERDWVHFFFAFLILNKTEAKVCLSLAVFNFN